MAQHNTYNDLQTYSPSSRPIGMVESQTHTQLGLAHNQIQSRWVERVSKPMPKQAWRAIKPKSDRHGSSLNPCPIGLGTQLSLRVLGLASFQTQAHRQRVCQFARLMLVWARHVSEPKDVGSDRSPNSYSFGLYKQLNSRTLSLIPNQTHVYFGSARN